jgi:negative regulator of genetic competence, sporulation and motility
MMSRDEMKKYGIDGDNIDYDDPKTRRSFWRILDAAHEKCGFEASGDKILIQFYPAKDGSEIFVTKLGLISSGAEKTIARSSKVAMLEARVAVYRFEDLLAAAEAARYLLKNDARAASRAFVDDNGIYYIITEERSTKRGGELRTVSEFGSEIPPNLSSYIKEHAKEVSFNSITKI